jgi:ABC-type cobalamin/Fe3+-siderophores transport system ATPase subunit
MLQVENKKIALGHLKSLETSIGFSNTMNLEMNNLSLLTGKNGSGKTLILIQIWIINFIAEVYLNTKDISVTRAQLQYIFDRSFDVNDFTGKLLAKFNDSELEFEIEKGKIESFLFRTPHSLSDLQGNGMPIFMSKDTRLFSDIDKYLKFKKLLGIGDLSTITQENIDTLSESYKIYEIFFIERMLTRLSDPFFKVPEGVKDFIKSECNKDIVHIFYDKNQNQIMVTELRGGESQSYPITRLSAGEQAWINMNIQN